MVVEGGSNFTSRVTEGGKNNPLPDAKEIESLLREQQGFGYIRLKLEAADGDKAIYKLRIPVDQFEDFSRTQLVALGFDPTLSQRLDCVKHKRWKIPASSMETYVCNKRGTHGFDAVKQWLHENPVFRNVRFFKIDNGVSKSTYIIMPPHDAEPHQLFKNRPPEGFKIERSILVTIHEDEMRQLLGNIVGRVRGGN